MKILSYIFLFYVGFYFYRLAENHQKNKWLFAIIGIITYLLSLFIYPLYLRLFYKEEILDINLVLVSLKSFLIALISLFILFQVLSFMWNKKEKVNNQEINTIGNHKK
ncbi:hypothetical protein [Polaribacter sp.]|uniref:hypothetical protein n=1 Tax=Polaribacter sp. TaxID=1920175 RepID=UPI003F6D4EFF